MYDDGRDTRNVIPRWRPLAGIERRDLASLGQFTDRTHSNTLSDYRSELKIWLDESSLQSAADLFDTYILTGDVVTLRQSLRILEKYPDQIPLRLKTAVETALRGETDILELRHQISAQESDDQYVYHSIRLAKRRIKRFPRNAFSYLELARLYTIVGQFQKAEKSLHSARVLAPDNRVILRATMQFYDIVNGLELGLKILRSSDRIKVDPWLQSAEIAASTVSGKSSRVANRRLIQNLKGSKIDRDHSELAMALATLESDSGVKENRVFQLVGKALPAVTENGLAQAVFLSNHSSRWFSERYPEHQPSSEAYEAKVRLAMKKKDFETAANYARFWVEDQPFSQDAIIQLLNLRSVHVSTDSFAVQTARRAMTAYGDNWHVLNGVLLVFASAGFFDEADKALERLKRFTPMGANQAFVYAATGFLNFAKGDFLRGQKAYIEAGRVALSHKRHDLLLNSTLFLLRCEAKNGLVSASCLEDLTTTIETALKRLPSSDREFLENTWFTTKKITLESVEENGELTVSPETDNLVHLLEESFESPPILIA